VNRIAVGAVLVALASACGGDVNAALEQLSEARRLSAELLIQFTKADDAANRAVMADTDEASVAYAEEAVKSKQEAQKELDALGPLLQGLRYSDENHLLQEFSTQFAKYRDLDDRILALAVQNTNLKAARLSFGPAQEAADAFRDALDSLVAADPPKDAWKVKALATTAVLTVREIQVLQAPHIANADDAVMTRMETRMNASEATARRTLTTLGTLVGVASRPRLAAATEALDQFMRVNGQIIALSRQNTNVRSLILALNDKRPLVTACEARLRELQQALAKRGYRGR